MREYRRINNLTGWIVFIIAAMLYLYTMESSVSLWDCGEFAAASYKLEVGHPPGAPLYLMLARIFSIFALYPPYAVVCINTLSALASAFTVLFLFWIITQLVRKIVLPEGSYQKEGIWKIMLSGLIGSLSFAVSDSFWFSAVEAEVYALSAFFTAIIFWAALKWEEAEGSYKNRWIVLIAYLLGLSVGIHLLNLLAIPALVMVVYFKNHKFQPLNFIGILFFSFFLLLFVLYILLPGTLQLAALFEIVSVNALRFPINSGMIFFVLLSVLVFIVFIRLTIRHEARTWNMILLSLAMLLTGYASYTMILIRSQANTPINTGNPSQVFSLLSYLKRDQYGSCPLFYGPYYNAPWKVVDAENTGYTIQKGHYVKLPPKKIYQYHENFKTLFPRMYSTNPEHVKVYKDWGSVQGQPVKYQKEDGSEAVLMKPTFIENLQFFITYQVGYMYLRYFMWNFAGKQNDMQGNGGIMKGNWITGFDLLDRYMIGPQRQLPAYMKNNPGHNTYFMFPLVLGFFGLIYHLRNQRHFFWTVFTLFLFTGLAIVVYTNQTPLQPRERDYVYVGSFFTFCIWIGMGFIPVYHLFKRIFRKRLALCTAIIISGVVPLLMGAQNFDDHNRHGRKYIYDIAHNYLATCAPNAILFTLGDNDTFPLWYMQEVEGFRTDVRIINISLLGADWYAQSLSRKVYDSEGIPCKSAFQNKAWVYIADKSNQTISLDSLVGSFTLLPKIGPAQECYINRDVYIQRDIPNSGKKIQPERFSLPGSYLMYNQLMVLEIIEKAGKNRPVYFTGLGPRITMGLDSFTRLDGFSYQLTGYKNNPPETDLLYKNLMVNSTWDNFIKGQGMVDDHLINMSRIMRIRQNFAFLAKTLAEEGKKNRGLQVLRKVMEILPVNRFPLDGNCIPIIEAFYMCGDQKSGNQLRKAYDQQLQEELNFYNHLYPWMNEWVETEKNTAWFYLNKLNKFEVETDKP